MRIVVNLGLMLLFLSLPASISAFNTQPGPVTNTTLESDCDQNRIADAFEDLVANTLDKGDGDSLVRFVVLLTSAPDDGDVTLVLRLGGEVSHQYSRTINGMAGKIPASAVSDLVAGWGPKLRLLDLDHEMTLAMDKSVPQTRARPVVWDAVQDGGYGLEGDSGTTIAILDTGIDPTHPDLAGKLVFWHDFHEESQSYAADYNSHGTFVAGLACGTGVVGGNEPRTELTYTIWHASAYGWPQQVTTEVPVLDNGLVTMDMAWTPAGETCFGLFPLDGPEGPLYCSSSSPNIHTWSINESGYYVVHFPFDGILDYFEWSMQITSPYEHQGDGYNLFRGMAPGCNLAGMKIMNVSGNGVGFSSATIAAMEFLVGNNSLFNAKVANISAGSPGSIALREAASAVMDGGTVLVGVAHNGFPGIIGDPGNSPQIITVGAVNDHGYLTNYTSRGHPGLPAKPDVLAPGGSGPPPIGRGAGLMGVDSNTSDGYVYSNYPDRVPDDYCQNAWGTSWAAPHVAGLAALVIQALERTGYIWNYTQADALLVKNIILMTATETNFPREETAYDYDPSLDRGGKDRQEGYGMINADAAVEAVLNSWPSGSSVSINFGEGFADRRCWAASLNSADNTVMVNLDVPSTLDADLYIYKLDYVNGDPDLVASSINDNQGDGEAIVFTPEIGVEYYLTVKRISGFGEAHLVSGNSSAENEVIQKTGLVGSYPNPFNPRTTIKFTMGKEENIDVSVYDVAGRKIVVLANGLFQVGPHTASWDGTDNGGNVVAAGQYFVRMKTQDSVDVLKIMMTK